MAREGEEEELKKEDKEEETCSWVEERESERFSEIWRR